MPFKPLTGKTNDFLRIVLPACASGKRDAVQAYLTDERPFVHWIGPHGRTMLWEAARKGKLPVVQLLVEEHDANTHAIGCYLRETYIEVSPWLIATLHQKAATADYLADHGAGLDFNSACYLGERDDVERTLADDPDAANRVFVRQHRWNGYTVWPIQYAVVGGQLEIVKRLLEAGANPTASPQILFDAVANQKLDIADVLLAAGADPRSTRQREWLEDVQFNALARRHGYDILEANVEPEKWPAIVEACRGNHNAPDDPQRVIPLLEADHDVNTRDYRGKTALHRASQAGFLKISQLLFKHGADLEARSDEGETPLFDAAFYGRVEQVGLLVEQGAQLEANNLNEETPVFAAVRGGQAAALQQLHTLGASLSAVNAKGQSPWDVASRSRKQGIEEVRQVLQTLEATDRS